MIGRASNRLARIIELGLAFAQSVLGLKLETIYRGIIPFVIIYLVALALITYIPEISLIGERALLAKG